MKWESKIRRLAVESWQTSRSVMKNCISLSEITSHAKRFCLRKQVNSVFFLVFTLQKSWWRVCQETWSLLCIPPATCQYRALNNRHFIDQDVDKPRHVDVASFHPPACKVVCWRQSTRAESREMYQSSLQTPLFDFAPSATKPFHTREVLRMNIHRENKDHDSVPHLLIVCNVWQVHALHPSHH